MLFLRGSGGGLHLASCSTPGSRGDGDDSSQGSSRNDANLSSRPLHTCIIVLLMHLLVQKRKRFRRKTFKGREIEKLLGLAAELGTELLSPERGVSLPLSALLSGLGLGLLLLSHSLPVKATVTRFCDEALRTRIPAGQRSPPLPADHRDGLLASAVWFSSLLPLRDLPPVPLVSGRVVLWSWLSLGAMVRRVFFCIYVAPGVCKRPFYSPPPPLHLSCLSSLSPS